MELRDIVPVIASVLANGALLIAFRVNLEHRLTRLETHLEFLTKDNR